VKYAAAVFDLDGTLVDNLPYHLQAWQQMSGQLGVEMTPERMEHEFSGRKNEEIIPVLLGRAVPHDELQRLAEQKEQLYRDLFRPHMKPLPGAVELLQRLKAAGYKLAVASAAPAKNRAMVLDGLQLRAHFDAVVGGEDAARGKPAPDIFLAAAKKLGVDPSKCIAFEDAVLGVQAARAAGMDTAAVTTTTSAENLLKAGAQWTATDFTALPQELLRALF
jgi:beta-phosphoglucomutase family hydrolase